MCAFALRRLSKALSLLRSRHPLGQTWIQSRAKQSVLSHKKAYCLAYRSKTYHHQLPQQFLMPCKSILSFLIHTGFTPDRLPGSFEWPQNSMPKSWSRI
jgi:hypothetical protein